MKKTLSILLVAFLIGAVTTVDSKPRKPGRIVKGEWGGHHIGINVSESNATVEFDCANGEISGPLIVDRRGRFDLKGTFNREGPGPIRDDAKGNSQSARYSGWTDGRKMTLIVTVGDNKKAIGTFNLTHDAPGRIFKCR